MASSLAMDARDAPAFDDKDAPPFEDLEFFEDFEDCLPVSPPSSFIRRADCGFPAAFFEPFDVIFDPFCMLCACVCIDQLAH